MRSRRRSPRPLRPRAILALGISFVLLAASHAAAGDRATIREIARLGPDVITTLRLESWMRGMKVPDSYPETPDPVVTDVLVHKLLAEIELREIRRAGVRIRASVLDRAVESRLTEMGADAATRRRLEASGQIELLRLQFEHGFLLQRYYLRHASVGEGADRLDAIIRPGEVAKYYEENLALFEAPEAAHVRLLFRKGPAEERETTRAAAANLADRVRAGASFADLARAESHGARAEAGGDFGWLTRDQMHPDIAAWAFEAAPGDVSDPIETAEGAFWIVEVVARRPAGPRPYAEVQNAIADRLREERLVDLRRRAMADLVRRARVAPAWVEKELIAAAAQLPAPGR